MASSLGSHKRKVQHVGQFELGKTLGQGSFSKVKLGTNVFTGEKVAVKIIDWSLADDLDDAAESVAREIRIMQLLHHPNIVQLHDIVAHKDDKKTYLILEYVSRGELFDYIVANGRIREPESRRYFRQLVSAVEYCHGWLVIHRDLKPSNLLLADDGSIKITDFGLSNTMTPGSLLNTWCGSLYYSAPEIIEEKKYVGPAVDCWSVGVILYALVNGRLPWSGKTDLEKIKQIVVSDMAAPDPSVSKECMALVKGCLRVSPERRYTIQDIRQDPWTNEGYDTEPECLLPETDPVAKVSDTIMVQLVFLGLLKDDQASIAAAKEAILQNKRQQVVFAYHVLMKDKGLEQSISASFLPAARIRKAVEAARKASLEDNAAIAAAVAATGAGGHGPNGKEHKVSPIRAPADDSSDDEGVPVNLKAPSRSQHRIVAPRGSPVRKTSEELVDNILDDLDELISETKQRAGRAVSKPSALRVTSMSPTTSGRIPNPMVRRTQELEVRPGRSRSAAPAPVVNFAEHDASGSASGSGSGSGSVSVSVRPAPPTSSSSARRGDSSLSTVSVRPAVNHHSSIRNDNSSNTRGSGGSSSRPSEPRRRASSVSVRPPQAIVQPSISAEEEGISGASGSPGAGRRVTDVLRLKFLSRQRSQRSTPSTPVHSVQEGRVSSGSAIGPRGPIEGPPAAQSSGSGVRGRGRSQSMGTAARVVAKPDPNMLANLPSAAEVDAQSAKNAASPLSTKSSAEEKSPNFAARIFRRGRNVTSGETRIRSSSMAITTRQTGIPSGHTWDGVSLGDAARRSRKRADDEMRTVKGVFKVSTTSLLAPDQIVLEIEDAIRALAGARPEGALKAKRKSAWVFRLDDTINKVRVEIEVCKIEKLDRLHGLRFARLRGDTWQYKQFAEEVMSNVSI